MVNQMLFSFIENGTPLKNLLKSRILFSTLLQNIKEETFSKSESIVQNVFEQLNDNSNLQLNLEQFSLTFILLTIATFHNYNIIFNKKIYTTSLEQFTKNVKLFIMIILFILSKNVDTAQ